MKSNSNSHSYFVNENIKAARVIVISNDGARLGEFLKADAIHLAEDRDLDLVLVSEGEKPVCRIMDFGKFLYEQKKKEKQNKSHKVDVKEIKFGFQTEEDYIRIKANQARKFLEDGDKVKVSIKFVGREAQHMKLIFQKCYEFYKGLEDIAEFESKPKAGDQTVHMILAKK